MMWTAPICKPVHGPEWHIQKDVIRFLGARGWNVEHTHGNLYQTGFPDLLRCAQTMGHPLDRLQAAQAVIQLHEGRYKQKWPAWEAYGIGIWILTAATQAEYDKLFAVPTWCLNAKGKLENPQRLLSFK